MFQTVSHDHSTRNKNNLHMPRFTNTRSQSYFIYHAVTEWNGLPSDIKNSSYFKFINSNCQLSSRFNQSRTCFLCVTFVKLFKTLEVDGGSGGGGRFPRAARRFNSLVEQPVPYLSPLVWAPKKDRGARGTMRGSAMWR